MPGFDGSGPRGFGAGTGQGMGSCKAGVGFGRRCVGRGFGGRGFGFNRNDRQTLEAEEKLLEQELAAIREQKATLEPEQK